VSPALDRRRDHIPGGDPMTAPLRWLAALLLAVLPLAQAHAQAWPNKPIRWIVPYPPGGQTDIISRWLGERLQPVLGQPIVIENRAGAQGIVGLQALKQSPADGYTVAYANVSNLAINQFAYVKLPYDPLEDFEFVSQIGLSSLGMVVPSSLGLKSVDDFVAHVRRNPGKTTFASFGAGSSSHLYGEMLKGAAKLDMVHVPYKGAAPSMIDLIGGQVHSTFAQPASVLPHAKAGKIKVLGVTSKKRLASWPDAPPVTETVAGYESASWQGLVVPARTPGLVVERLYREVVAALNSTDLRKRLTDEGSEIGGMPPAEFTNYIRTEIAKWTRVVREANIQVQ
jgi:tripartite-type tricarboxylate transporter receptor subunit TctC